MALTTSTNLFAPFEGVKFILQDRSGGLHLFESREELLKEIDGYEPQGVMDLEHDGRWHCFAWPRPSDMTEVIARAWVELNQTNIEWDEDFEDWNVDPFFVDAAKEILGARPSNDTAHFRNLQSELR